MPRPDPGPLRLDVYRTPAGKYRFDLVYTANGRVAMRSHDGPEDDGYARRADMEHALEVLATHGQLALALGLARLRGGAEVPVRGGEGQPEEGA